MGVESQFFVDGELADGRLWGCLAMSPKGIVETVAPGTDLMRSGAFRVKVAAGDRSKQGKRSRETTFPKGVHHPVLNETYWTSMSAYFPSNSCEGWRKISTRTYWKSTRFDSSQSENDTNASSASLSSLFT